MGNCVTGSKAKYKISDEKSKGSKIIVSDQNKQIKPEHASGTTNPKNLEDPDVNSSHFREEEEIDKQRFGEINSADNQQISEQKVPDLHHATEDINGTENINNLISPSVQDNIKEFERTGDSRESDNKCLSSLSEEDSFENQNHSSKIIEDKEKSFQENTEESGETGVSREVEKHSRENQIQSTINEIKQILQENIVESEKTSASRQAEEDIYKHQSQSTGDENKQIAVPEPKETGDSTEEAKDPAENEIRSNTNEVKQIFQENIEESEITNASRQAEEDICKHQSQSTGDEDKQLSVQENNKESKKTGDSKQAEDFYENQIPSPEKSESNILHVDPHVENNSSLSNEEQSKTQEQQEDKKLEKSSRTNILNLQEHFTNSDPRNITSQNHSIEYILEIEERAKKFDDKVAKYSGTNYSVDYFVIDENLARLIECLDKVKLQQDEHLLKEKIRVIDYIRSLQLRLDENVTEK